MKLHGEKNTRMRDKLYNLFLLSILIGMLVLLYYAKHT